MQKKGNRNGGHLNMDRRIIFNIVKQCIDRLDYYGLLASGAPEDEFDRESMEISAQLSENSTTHEIAAMIASVFERSFGNSERASSFLALASEIKRELSQNDTDKR